MNRSAQLARQRGFTLIETMIALGVFMTGLLALVSLQVSVIRSVQLANEVALATNLASSQLEELELMAFDTFDDFAANPKLYDIAGADTEDEDATYYTVTIEVTGDAFLRDVTVTTSWLYNGTEEHAVAMTSQYWEE